MFDAYRTLPQPFIPAPAVNLLDRWYPVFADAAGTLHTVHELPWTSADLARRATTLFCASVGDNGKLFVRKRGLYD